MMKIIVNSEKSGNFVSKSNSKKPMIYIESKRRPLEPQKEKAPSTLLAAYLCHSPTTSPFQLKAFGKD